LKQNNISILLIEESQNGVRQFSLPRPFFIMILATFLVAASALGWIIYDYRTLKPRMAELLKAENLSLHHKKQIAYLGQRIQVIRQKLEELDVYDQKLRNIARVATGYEGRSLVGVGGSDSRPSGIEAAMPEPEENMIQSEDPANGEDNISKQKEGAVLDFIKTWTFIPSSTSARRLSRGWVCAKFGGRIAPYGGSREFHKGVDIATRSNAQVLAPADGIVTSVDWQEGYGRRVVVAHGFGVVSIFAHLDKVLVTRGERLVQGAPIALAGGTGRSTGPYIHYEVHFYGVPVDPQQYMLPTLQ
jgi:murein DD-endopeptidase MepM/ murein hydrolase activator NlpD